MRNPLCSWRLSKALSFVFFAALASCSGSEDEETTTAFVIANSGFAAAGSTPLAINGPWLAFLADEAASGGQDLNNDGQAGIDSVAIAVNLVSKAETNLGVAAISAVWVGAELYLVVDEVADNFDHGGSVGISDLVLMHWNSSMTDPVFISALERDSATRMVAVGSTLFYVSDRTPAGIGESSMYAIAEEFPETSRPVFTQDTNDSRSPRILGEQEGLVLLVYDETVEGVALNGDGNVDDTHVLALLDGTGVVDASGYSLLVRNTGLTVRDDDTPFRAANQGANDWLLGFLVDESSQEANFNVFDGITLPASWQVGTCSSPDSDQNDRVLHVIRFLQWDIDPALDPPVNTGLAGRERVLIVDDAVATICRESDENGCIFNNDGDSVDRILRWIRIDSSTAPYSSAGPAIGLPQLIALDFQLAGPALAVAELDGAFVVQCDEGKDGRDHDGNPGSNRDLIAWLDPQDAGPVWKFNHSTGGEFYATATWMGEQPQQTRLGLAFAESSNNDDLNGDGDKLDSMPNWADLGGSPRRLSFVGRFLAAQKDNAGITLANGHGFFRFSEPDHGADTNGNGNSTDILLVRVNLSTGLASNMGILNNLTRLAMETEPGGSGAGGAFLFDETLIGTDLNGDSDTNDLVPRFFQLP